MPARVASPCRAKNPSGEDINALEQHIKNLLSPSTPDFFNTLVRQPAHILQACVLDSNASSGLLHVLP